jgi:hypothetical protein
MKNPWSAKDDPLLAAWLDTNARPLVLVGEASRRPRYYMPQISTNSRFVVMALLLPQSAQYREAARALVARAMLKAAAGDTDSGWADLMTVFRLGGLLGQSPHLLGRMVGIVVSDIACQATQALAGRERLSPGRARLMLGDLQSLPEVPDLADSIDHSERFELLDVAVTCSRENFIDLSDIGGSAQRASVVGVDWNKVLRTVNQLYDQQVDVFRHPTFTTRKEVGERIEAERKACQARVNRLFRSPWLYFRAPIRLRGSNEVADYLISVLTRSLSETHISGDRARTDRSLTLLSLALAAYRAEKGHYPEKLDDLSPDYLERIPEDVFTGQPLKYNRTADGYLLYSFGPNMTDDGGQSGRKADPKKDDIAVRVPPGEGPTTRP